jgi:hypothetical protein
MRLCKHSTPHKGAPALLPLPSPSSPPLPLSLSPLHLPSPPSPSPSPPALSPRGHHRRFREAHSLLLPPSVSPTPFIITITVVTVRLRVGLLICPGPPLPFRLRVWHVPMERMSTAYECTLQSVHRVRYVPTGGRVCKWVYGWASVWVGECMSVHYRAYITECTSHSVHVYISIHCRCSIHHRHHRHHIHHMAACSTCPYAPLQYTVHVHIIILTVLLI